MLIPNSYKVEEGKEFPSGAVTKECKYCHGTFAIPSEEAAKYEKSYCCDAEACKEASDKEAALAASALMKSNADTQKEINAAIGQ